MHKKTEFPLDFVVGIRATNKCIFIYIYKFQEGVIINDTEHGNTNLVVSTMTMRIAQHDNTFIFKHSFCMKYATSKI